MKLKIISKARKSQEAMNASYSLFEIGLDVTCDENSLNHNFHWPFTIFTQTLLTPPPKFYITICFQIYSCIMVYVKMVNWRMVGQSLQLYMKFKLNKNGQNDNIYKGIISKERKVTFCLQYLIQYLAKYQKARKSENSSTSLSQRKICLYFSLLHPTMQKTFPICQQNAVRG